MNDKHIEEYEEVEYKLTGPTWAKQLVVNIFEYVDKKKYQ